MTHRGGAVENKKSDLTDAGQLVGANPRGAVSRISLAVRQTFRDLFGSAGISDSCSDGSVMDDFPGFTLTLGVSGGADSLAMAVCALDIASREGVRVQTVTVDHGIRPESAQEAQEVVTMLQRMGAESQLIRVQVDNAGGPEAGARQARRNALVEQAKIFAAHHGMARAVIFLGHTMDDQAETVLLRLARGSGAGSLRAMSRYSVEDLSRKEYREDLDMYPQADVEWARPLLDIRRADTVQACIDLGLQWVEDPTNSIDGPWRAQDGTPLRRVAVRQCALPALSQALGVDPVPALARTASALAHDDDALEAMADDLWERVVLCDAPLTVRVCDVMSAAPAVRDRVLHRLAQQAGAYPGQLSYRHISALTHLCRNGHAGSSTNLPGVNAKIVRNTPNRRGRDALQLVFTSN